jgi:hypothetical protein
MSSTTTNVGIRLTLDGVQQVESGLNRVQNLAGGAAKALAGIAGGVFSAAAFSGWIKGAIDAADETNKLTQKTGLLAEQVAGLKLAFELGGAGDAFASSLSRLAKEAVNGNKAFAAMGISVTDAGGKMKTTRDLFGEVADKFAGYGAGLEKNALAVQIFGKAGADLIPVLNGGSASIAEMDDKAKALGLTMSGEMVKAAEQFNDQMDLIKGGLQGAAIQISSALLPALVQLSGGLAESAEQGGAVAQVGNGLATVFETVAVLGSNVGYVLKQIGNELGGLAAQAVQVAKLDFAAAGEIGRMMRADAAEARKDIDGLTDRLINARRRATIGISSPGDQTSAEDRRLGLSSGRTTAPIVSTAGSTRAASGGRARADNSAERELAEQRKRELDVIKLRNELVGKAWEEEQKQLQAASEAYAGLIEQRQAQAQSVQDAAESQRLLNEEFGLEGMALLELQNARLLDAAAALDRRAALAQDVDLSGALSESYQAEAQALRDLAAAKMTAETQRAQKTAVDKQRREYEQLWQGVESFAENAFMDVALNGESAFKRIGESLKREVLQMLYEMTIKKWIFQISGVGSGGGGSAGSIMDYASSAYSAYTTGAAGGAGSAAAVGGSASAVGSYVGGSMSAANAYGSIYANATGTGINGLLATNGAYGTAGAGGVAGSSTASAVGYLGYAALIAAAVLIAENLYAKGYNRAALGKGPGESNTVGNTTFTADTRFGNSSVYNGSAENLNRQLFDAVGVNNKWADILSGTTRMATLFGRKLGAYGFTADIAGGDAEVGGFTRYKGGVFRSNKTVKTDVDPKDAASFDAIVESQIEGSKAMARAMGLSDEAINKYTGSLKVNFKGAKTAEEQSKRMAEAMDNLNFELLKTASGGKLAREDFKKFLEDIQGDIQAAGISGEGIADIFLSAMTGRISGQDAGGQLADMVLGGIYNAVASSGAAQISQLFMQQIITPIFTAIASGVPIAQAVSAASIKATVETAKQYMEVVKATFNDPEFRAFMDELRGALTTAGGAAASVATPSMRTFSAGPSAAQTAAAEAKREKEQLEREILRLEGNTTELRRRELLDVGKGNRALQERIWALEDEQKALDQVTQLKDAWTDLTGSIEEEIKRLRGIVSGEGEASMAYLQAQFAIVTGQARAMDQAAAGRLPELSSQLADSFLESSTSRNEYQRRVNDLAASLEETNRITRSTAGIGADNAQKVEDKALAQKIELLQKSIDVLAAAQSESAKVLAKVTSNGNAMRTTPA